MISGVFWGRILADAGNPLQFTVPNEVLGVLGLSLGSAVAATVVKSYKNVNQPESVSASDAHDLPRLSQIVTLEEGPYADKLIDVAKFQQFSVTLILAASYIASAATQFTNAGSPLKVNGIPSFSPTFLALLGISHAGYVAGKIPSPSYGAPAPGMTVEKLNTGTPVISPRNPPARRK